MIPKIAVVTSIFGGIDNFRSIPSQSYNKFDFFFINENFKHPNFPPDFDSFSDRYKAKYCKILLHRLFPNYDIYIWLDGCLEIISGNTIEYILNELWIDNSDMLIQKHHHTNCIFKEEQIILNSLDENISTDHSFYFASRFTRQEIVRQVDAYRNEILPESGYWLGGLFARRNNDITNEFFNQWWDKIIQFGLRDQFHLAYLIIANPSNLKIKQIESILNSYLIKWNDHELIK